MLDLDTRQAILRLKAEGHGARTIARALSISRNSARQVLREGTATAQVAERESQLQTHVDAIRELYADCRGNLVRVHEELAAKNIVVGYPTLTAFCRRIGLGEPPPEPAGRYHFEPGQEMQHDTSPHVVEVGGKRRKLACASLVLCHSRMIFAQCYTSFNRFWAKVFLTDALVYFGGAARQCMIDNSNVLIAYGTGKHAVPAPEISAFAERFGFAIEAHEVGDADRSARVERPFSFIENNFYPGRRFASLEDLNTQQRAWCDRVNARYKKHIRAVPRELFVVERPVLRPLPIHVPEVYELVARIVDVEGYVHLHTNRYSIPPAHKNKSLLHRSVRLRASKARVRIFDGRDLVADHPRLEDGAHAWSTLPEHTRARRERPPKQREHDEEKLLYAASPAIGKLVDLLKAGPKTSVHRSLRQLQRLYFDYPTDALAAAAELAVAHKLLDLRRIEDLVLTRVGETVFRLTNVLDELNDDDGYNPEASDDG